jgi:hypothetical protein
MTVSDEKGWVGGNEKTKREKKRRQKGASGKQP